ncbi:hypothetical protein D3C85_930750 [compost metagenome]
MQRDMDLVRTILIKIDEAKQPIRMIDLLAEDATDDDLAAVQYHLAMLVDEVGFVRGIKAHTLGGKNWIDLNLTWNGHEFLDNVRDPEIWRQTKTGAVKAGQWSIKTLADIAVAIGKARIEQLITTGQLL